MSNDEFEKKNQFSTKNCPVGRQPRKNKRVKYLIVKKIKTQTMQTKHDIKKWMKIIRAKLENKKN